MAAGYRALADLQPARVDAVGGDQAVGFRRQVRGRVAELAAALGAVHDHPANRGGVAEQHGGFGDAALARAVRGSTSTTPGGRPAA